MSDIRDLSEIECNQVSGSGPTEPPQPFPPITLKGPAKPEPGPLPFQGPNPGPFHIG
jgi:hypothetical protein